MVKLRKSQRAVHNSATLPLPHWLLGACTDFTVEAVVSKNSNRVGNQNLHSKGIGDGGGGGPSAPSTHYTF